MGRHLDMTPLTEEQRSLAERFHRCARNIAWDYVRRNSRSMHIDDYESAAQMALITAVKKYDPSKGPPDYFITKGIRMSMHRELYKTRPKGYRSPKHKSRPLLFTIHSRHTDDRSTTIIENNLAVYDDYESTITIREIIASLPTKWHHALTLVWIEELNNAQAAKIIGISRSRVHAIVKKAREILADRKYNWLDE